MIFVCLCTNDANDVNWSMLMTLIDANDVNANDVFDDVQQLASLCLQVSLTLVIV